MRWPPGIHDGGSGFFEQKEQKERRNEGSEVTRSRLRVASFLLFQLNRIFRPGRTADPARRDSSAAASGGCQVVAVVAPGRLV